jgi:hypothetical protein
MRGSYMLVYTVKAVSVFLSEILQRVVPGHVKYVQASPSSRRPSSLVASRVYVVVYVGVKCTGGWGKLGRLESRCLRPLLSNRPGYSDR